METATQKAVKQMMGAYEEEDMFSVWAYEDFILCIRSQRLVDYICQDVDDLGWFLDNYMERLMRFRFTYRMSN